MALLGHWLDVQRVPGTGALIRPEPFGGTISFRRPEMLVLLDRAWMGMREAEVDSRRALDPAVPFEAHLTLGRACRSGCKACYIDARPEAGPALGFEEWKDVLCHLASLGVFHVALGGGESLAFDDLLGLARHARQLGMTPNLSTAGLDLTPRWAERLSVFERVHLSLDGADEASYRAVRGRDGFGSALHALRILRAYHPRVGINCIVARSNIDSLGELFRLLDRERVREAELLRFKPVGRGGAHFEQMDWTAEQARSVVRNVLRWSLRFRIRVRLDCSFTPMVCAAGYRPERLVRLGLAGCVAGTWLVSIDPEGRLSGCSFDDDSRAHWRDLGRPNPDLDRYRLWLDRAPEPCASCAYLAICRGGCHVVARYVCGDFFAPDPACPRVQATSGSDR
ncbi:MAG: radical SAM protein [Deltaproteobacteria bacterium]|nr:radical SAM protein [Deltaproteobacteria bacterium]